MRCGYTAVPYQCDSGTSQGEDTGNCEKMGYNGGFIFAASHHIQQDTPVENIEALFEILDDSGQFSWNA